MEKCRSEKKIHRFKILRFVLNADTIDSICLVVQWFSSIFYARIVSVYRAKITSVRMNEKKNPNANRSIYQLITIRICSITLHNIPFGKQILLLYE